MGIETLVTSTIHNKRYEYEQNYICGRDRSYHI